MQPYLLMVCLHWAGSHCSTSGNFQQSKPACVLPPCFIPRANKDWDEVLGGTFWAISKAFGAYFEVVLQGGDSYGASQLPNVWFFEDWLLRLFLREVLCCFNKCCLRFGILKPLRSWFALNMSVGRDLCECMGTQTVGSHIHTDIQKEFKCNLICVSNKKQLWQENLHHKCCYTDVSSPRQEESVLFHKFAVRVLIHNCIFFPLSILSPSFPQTIEKFH